MLSSTDMRKIQNVLQYQFANQSLLQQAFTRKSFKTVYGGVDNELLEFYGDRVLALAVVLDLNEKFSKFNLKNEIVCSKSLGELNKLDIQTIKNSTLADCITRLHLEKYLQVANVCERKQMKNQADSFEAILGAVALDSGWNLSAIKKVYNSMINASSLYKEDVRPTDYRDLFNWQLDKFGVIATHPKYEQVEGGLACHFEMIVDGKTCRISTLKASASESKNAAARIASVILALVKDGRLVSEDEMSYAEQLSLLSKFGFVENLEYRYEFFPYSKNKPRDLWRCYVTSDECDCEFCAESDEMVDAKNLASYALLCNLLCIEADDFEFCPAGEIHGQGLLRLVLSKYFGENVCVA